MHEKSAYIIIWRKQQKKDWSVVSGYTAEKCMAIYSEIFAEGRGMDGYHRLNMELDLQSLFGLHVHSCTHWLRQPPPRIYRLI